MKLSRLLSKISVPKHIEYPTISPVPDDVHRPFWSVMIPTYNRTTYLEQTLKSVLEQDPGPEEMQIEVIDNCSTEGNPEEIVRRLAGERVSLYRQPYNVSMAANWNTCIGRARGYWVHILHDDDMVMPGFYATYKRFIEEHSEVVMVFCRAIQIDETDEWIAIMYSAPHRTSSGIVENAAYELVEGNFICAPTAVVARVVYEKTGGFAPCLSHTPDWEMWMRIALNGPIGYIHHPYLLYRVHPASDTSRLVRSAKNIEEIVQTVEIGVQRLPLEKQKTTRYRAYRRYAAYADDFRSTLHAKGHHTAALRHALWAFKLDLSLDYLMNVVNAGFKSLFWK